MSTPRSIYTQGQLNQLVQLQARADGRNALNERTGAWTDEGQPIYAAVTHVRGQEHLAAGALQQTLDAIFVVRYRASITADKRLVHKGQPYDIIAAVPIQGGEYLEISAVTGARDGR